MKEPVADGQRARAKHRQQQNIIDAASALLLKHSFDQITTKQVAKEARISEATLYRYISSKHELLTLVYGDQLDQVLNQIENSDAKIQSQTPTSIRTAQYYIKRVHKVYKVRCDFYLLNPANASLYLREGFNPDNPDSSRHLAQGDRTIRLVAQIIDEGQMSRWLRRDLEPYPVAQNLHAVYMHEIDRTPVRRFDPATIWTRLRPRLDAQLLPLEQKHRLKRDHSDPTT